MLKSSNKPLMVASGCSHTDLNFKSINHPEMDTFWPKWPQVFAEKHGYDHINVGRSGAGNDTISNSIIDAVTDYPETKLVLILWSGWDRMNFYGSLFNPNAYSKENFETRIRRARHNPEQVAIMEQWYYRSVIRNGWEDISNQANKIITVEKLADRNLRIMYQTLEFLKHKNIKYLCASADYGMNQLIGNSKLDKKNNKRNLERLLNYILDHRYFDLLENQNFWGFPMFNQLGGRSIFKEPEFWIGPNPNLEYLISKYDSHANAKGQEKIAEIFSETYQKVYS